MDAYLSLVDIEILFFFVFNIKLQQIHLQANDQQANSQFISIFSIYFDSFRSNSVCLIAMIITSTNDFFCVCVCVFSHGLKSGDICL